MKELIKASRSESKPLWEIVLEMEKELFNQSREDILKEMRRRLDIMKKSAERGLQSEEFSASGLSGGDARKLWENGKSIAGRTMTKSMARAMAIGEENARMGRIVASPTAGASGVLPGALITIAEEHEKTDEDIVKALLTAAGIGLVIARNASISGAEGGCQAECGSASAMAAGAIVDLLGGTPDQVEQAVAICLKNVLGLVCDPVAALVEVPCIKRNAVGAVRAIAAAELALSGIRSMIPADEVIGAMQDIAGEMPTSLKETGRGGIAATKTARKLARRLGRSSGLL